MTHTTTTLAGHGIDVVLYRVGRVVFAKLTGTLSSNVAANGTLLTLASGYKPVEPFYCAIFVNSTSTPTRFAFNANGTVVPNVAISTGASVQGSVCFICAAY